MDVRSQLLNAQLEQTATNPTQKSKITYDTDDDLIKYGDGSGTKTVVEAAATQTLTNKTLTSPVLNTGVSGTAVLDEDSMSSNSDTKLATQQSIKAYVDNTAVAKSLVTTKGDIIAATASSTPARLGVGADNTVLTAASGESTGLIWASVASLNNLSVVSKTTTYTVQDTEDVILCDTSGGAWTLTLYAASGNSGKRVVVKKTTNDFNYLTIDGNASETIDGATTRKLITQYDEMTLVCDGSNWHILDRRYPKIWTSYTVAITGSSSNPTKATTPTSDVGQWMRSGDDEVYLRYTYFHSSATGAAAGSGNYSFSYPTGITTNATKVGSGTPVIGVGYVFTTTAFTGIAYAETSTLGLYVGNSSGAHVIAGSSTTALNNSTVQIGYEVRIPVSGWE